jgi:hypothetical protein
MRIEILIALLSLGGVIVGSTLTTISNYIQKRQERKAQLHKLLAEKRIEAYEDILANIKWCIIAVGIWKDGEFVKYPQVFTNSDQFSQWYVDFAVITRRSSHLIDRELAYKIHVFNNYLVNLNNRLDYFRDEHGQFHDNEKAQMFGALLYEDFRKLTSDILEEASKFYSSGIYSDKFVPSMLKEKDFDLPSDFTGLALFTKVAEMHKLLEGG